MKKILLTVAAVAAFMSVQAQDAKFGVKAGLNVYTLTGDIEGASSLTGFHVGGIAEFKLSDNFAIQPELMYSLQGAKSETSGSETTGGFTSSFSGESKVKLGYLNIPVLAKYYVAEGFSLQAGPQLGLLLNAKSEYDITSSAGGFSVSESGEMDVKDSFKSIDLGLAAGAGYDTEFGLFFQARYVVGLSNISEEADGEEFDIKNAGFQLSVGYKF